MTLKAPSLGFIKVRSSMAPSPRAVRRALTVNVVDASTLLTAIAPPGVRTIPGYLQLPNTLPA